MHTSLLHNRICAWLDTGETENLLRIYFSCKALC